MSRFSAILFDSREAPFDGVYQIKRLLPGCHNELRVARCRRPVPAPAALAPSPRPPAGGGCAAGGGRHFAGTPTSRLHARGADCAGRSSWCAGWVAITRFAQPDAAGVLAPATRRKHDTLLSRSSGGHQIVPIRLELADLPFHRGADIPVVSQPSPRARYSGMHTSAEADRFQDHALPFQQESLL